MKVVIAPDKFKGSLTADEVCKAILKGVRSAVPSIECSSYAMADGGDGSCEILKKYIPLDKKEVPSQDPLGRPMTGHYYYNGHEAYIDLSTCSGIVLLSQEELNPLHTSTYGTGLLIKAALEQGANKITLFIGGSATNDAGIGIAKALGYNFLDHQKNTLAPVGSSLSKVAEITALDLHRKLKQCTFRVVCDVDNPLYGDSGAAKVYGHQKGASEAEINELDNGLKNIGGLIYSGFNKDVQQLKGAGAAGGVGAGMVAFCNAEIINGTALFIELSGIETDILNADLIITGEGKIDQQIFNGKVVHGISKLASKHNTKLIALSGAHSLKAEDIQRLGISYLDTILNHATNVEDAMNNASTYLTNMSRDAILKMIR